MKDSPKQWEWVIKYGQFEQVDDETTEKEKRKKDRTHLPQNCLQDGYNRMEEYQRCVKECETSHKTTTATITTTTRINNKNQKQNSNNILKQKIVSVSGQFSL